MRAHQNNSAAAEMIATVSGVSMRRKLHQRQLFQLHPVAAHLRKVVLCLLHKPAFFGAAENLGQPDSLSGDMPRFAFTSSEACCALRQGRRRRP
jgi:hypothetical protein